MNLFDTNFLFASLLWGSIGVGYFIYGKKQQAMMPMIGGVVMVLASYFVSSWLLMSLICIALMVAVYLLAKARLLNWSARALSCRGFLLCGSGFLRFDGPGAIHRLGHNELALALF